LVSVALIAGLNGTTFSKILITVQLELETATLSLSALSLATSLDSACGRAIKVYAACPRAAARARACGWPVA
jgi:hypothetical protein